MINPSSFMESIGATIKDFCGIPQLLEAEQDQIPEDFYISPRIMWKLINPYGKDTYTPVKIWKTVNTSPPEGGGEPVFEKSLDLEIHKNPFIVISFTGYGDKHQHPVDEYIGKLRDWFDNGEYHLPTLDPLHVVVASVEEIGNRDTGLEEEYEVRRGFDVKLVFEEVVKIQQLPTVEGVNIKMKE